MHDARFVYRVAADRRAIIEALVCFVVGGQPSHVELAVVGDVDAGVDHALPAMLRRIAPDLHRQWVIGQLVGEVWVLLGEYHRNRPRSATAGAIVLVPFARDVDEACRADADPGRPRHLPALAAVEP